MSAGNSQDPKAPKQPEAGIELPKGQEAVADIPDGVFEDVYRFWKQYGSTILIYGVVALVVFLGAQGWKQYSSGREVALRNQYGELETLEAKLEFARNNPNHPLSGFTYLQAGKAAYEAKEFDKAAGYYLQAGKVIKDPALLSVVWMGEANSLRESGKESEAVRVLERIANEENFAEGIRAEAMFQRIVLALKRGDSQTVEHYTKLLESADPSQVWVQRLDSIKNYH
jgi:predicted negative regulator of RcsB-dependent stress response